MIWFSCFLLFQFNKQSGVFLGKLDGDDSVSLDNGAISTCGIEDLHAVEGEICGDREAILIAFKSPDDQARAILAFVCGTEPLIIVRRNLSQGIVRDRAVDIALVAL